jgi:hypothetical protein
MEKGLHDERPKPCVGLPIPPEFRAVLFRMIQVASNLVHRDGRTYETTMLLIDGAGVPLNGKGIG